MIVSKHLINIFIFLSLEEVSVCCFSFCYIYIYCLFRFVSRFNSQIVYERETHIMILEYICIRTPYLATL